MPKLSTVRSLSVTLVLFGLACAAPAQAPPKALTVPQRVRMMQSNDPNVRAQALVDLPADPEALRLLVDLIDGKERSNHLRLPTELVVRASCAPPRG